jgi:ppGpp synthetase/RelA/SpoT-type nucleotidyltranferase
MLKWVDQSGNRWLITLFQGYSVPLTDEIINQAVDRYWREHDRYSKLSEFVGEVCRKLLDANVIRGSVQWRAKNPDRLKAKLLKYKATNHRATEFTDVDSVFKVLKDLAGARITCYVEAERARVVDLVVKAFAGFGHDGKVEPDRKDHPPEFYRATHCMVQIKHDALIGRYANLKGLGCEVQVCSLLAHAYNEIEHDLRYKPLAGHLSEPEENLLNALGHLMEVGDTIINQTLDAVAARQKQNNAEFEDEYDFVARMRPLFSDAHNFATNAGQLYEACTKLGLDTPEKIMTDLQWTDTTPQTGKSLAEQLAAVVNPDSATQLEIDPMSSDQLLVLLVRNPQHVDRLKQYYPSGRGVGRAPRLLSVAKRLHDLPPPQHGGVSIE